MNLKKSILYVIDKYIWSIFEDVYGLNQQEIKSLIENILIDDIKWNGLKPCAMC